MRLNVQTYDQLRILSFVARRGPSGVKADEIALGLNMPVLQVQKLGAWLVQAKLLQSRRGPPGGMRLAGAPGELRLGQLVTRLEKLDGASPMHAANSDSPLGKVLRQAFSAMVCTLDEHSLAEFSLDCDHGR
ncbi:MAG: Rrf2 family transcriptional regulator [Hyphomicrobium sp.]